MEYKKFVLIMLKELNINHRFRKGVLLSIIDVIENKLNDEYYVYKYIANNIDNINTDDSKEIFSCLRKHGRL